MNYRRLSGGAEHLHGDTMATIDKVVRSILDSHFRGKGPVTTEFFPSHEFNEIEASDLAQFTSRICSDGYSFIDASEHKHILNLAAEYGVFVQADIGTWFLGL